MVDINKLAITRSGTDSITIWDKDTCQIVFTSKPSRSTDDLASSTWGYRTLYDVVRFNEDGKYEWGKDKYDLSMKWYREHINNIKGM